MEILLDIDSREDISCEELNEVLDSDKKELLKQFEIEGIRDAKYVNIGPGADFIVLLLIIDIGLRALKLGTEINDGIDGWIGIAKKLGKLFKKNKIVSIDEDGATSLAIGLIAQKIRINKLQKIDEMTINLMDVSGMIHGNYGLSFKPHNYYIQTYKVNNEDIFIIGITSAGDVNLIKHFGYNPYGIYDIQN